MRNGADACQNWSNAVLPSLSTFSASSCIFLSDSECDVKFDLF